MRIRYWFVLLFSVVAVCLAAAMFPSAAMCAEDDDFKISLPTKKDPKNSSKQDSVLPRANEMLQGVVYDLKLTKDKKATGNLSSLSSWNSRVLNSKSTKIIQQFVLGSWKKSVDAKGNIRYPELDEFYCSPTRVWNSCFYKEYLSGTEAPRLFACEDVVKSGGWVAIFSGYVVAPFTGKFRFVGLADDVILVRFNNKIVLDYGWFSCTMGTTFDSFGSYKTVLGASSSAKKPDAVSASPLYSKTPLSILPINYSESQERGLQRGPVLEVKKGDVIPIEVLLSEVGVGGFASMLFVERLDANGDPMEKDPKNLQLFRTTKHLPSHPKSDFPDFAENGPVWKVVDSFGKPIPASKYANQNVKIAFPVEIAKPAEKTVGTASDKTVEKTEKTGTVSGTSAPAASEQTKKEQTSRSVPYETMLQCVVYDLKQTRTRQSVSEFKSASGSTFRSELVTPTARILREFINGPWQKHYDKDGRVSFPALNEYYCLPNRLWSTCFYAEKTTSSNVPQMFAFEKDISPVACVFIYSGYVVAPFSGRFRFVGYGDDFMVVRFQKKLALDYGNYSATLGSEFNDTLRAKLSGSADQKTKNPIERKRPSMTESTYYTENRLVTCTPSFMSRTLAKGPILEVKKGEVIPIEILISDLGGDFSFALFLERVTVNGDPFYGKKPLYQLFRTSDDLPSPFSEKSFPDFEKGLIWTVVDVKGKTFPSHIKAVEETEESADSKTAAESKDGKNVK